MHPAPGDIYYAYRKTKPPSRRRWSMRIGLQHPVLRVTPWVNTDNDGNDWICVLPVTYGVLKTPLNPNDLKIIPAADATTYKESLNAQALELVQRVLNGDDPRYPWITTSEGTDADQRPSEDYPTLRDLLWTQQ